MESTGQPGRVGSLLLLQSVSTSSRPPSRALQAVCLCVLIPEGLASTPWDATIWGIPFMQPPFVPGCRPAAD